MRHRSRQGVMGEGGGSKRVEKAQKRMSDAETTTREGRSLRDYNFLRYRFEGVNVDLRNAQQAQGDEKVRIQFSQQVDSPPMLAKNGQPRLPRHQFRHRKAPALGPTSGHTEIRALPKVMLSS